MIPVFPVTRDEVVNKASGKGVTKRRTTDIASEIEIEFIGSEIE